MISTAADFLRELHQLHLLDQSQCTNLANLGSDAHVLARVSVQRGWLTPWQVNRIFQGRAADLLLGSYLLLEKLGEGGMGAVFKARNWKLGRVVAVKLVRKERLGSDSMVRRFRREIQAAGQLWHPNIVRALDADEVNGSHFFVMEYVEGRDLAKVVKERGPLPIDEACEYIRQAALGLQHAFERGLVHRDIKPSNLLLCSVGETASLRPDTAAKRGRFAYDAAVVKLLDMGLARFERSAEDESSTLTQMGTVVGTPDYIAPEQARDSHHADIRADLYSLGCTLYYLLAGRVPFPGGSVTEKLLKHQLDMPTPLPQLRPGVSHEVAGLVTRLLAKRPEERYQTPAELAAALEEFLHAPETITTTRRGHEQTMVAPASPFADIDLPDSGATEAETTPRRSQVASRPRWPLIAAGAAGVLLSTAVLVALVVPGRKDTNISADNLPPRKPDEPRPPRKPSQKELDALEARQREEAEQKRRADAEEALKLLIAKAAHAKTTFADFAKDVAAFKAKYGGTPAAIRAAELLMKLPSPLDQLDAKKLPADCLAAWKAEGRPVPAELVGVLGHHRVHHPGGIWALAVSLDGKLLATGGVDGVVRLTDMTTMHEVRKFPGHKAGVWSLQFSPDGKRLASGGGEGDTTIRLWDVETGKEWRRLEGSTSWITALAFSPDGHRLVSGHGHIGSPENVVRFWDVETGKQLDHFDGPKNKGPVYRVVFARDGNSLLTAHHLEQVVRIWDARTGKLVQPLEGRNGVSAMGEQTVWSAHGIIRQWAIPSGELVRSVDRATAGDFEFGDMSPDGKYAVLGGSDRRSLRLWDIAANRELHRLLENAGQQVFGVIFSADSRRIIVGQGDTVRLWDVATGKEVQPLTGHVGSVVGLAFSADDQRLITSGSDKSLRLWDASAMRERWSSDIEANFHGPAVGYSVDEQSILLLADVAQVVDGQTGKIARKFRTEHDGQNCYGAAFSSDGRMITGGADGTVFLWNVETGQPARKMGESRPTPGHDNRVTALCFSADGRTALSGGGYGSATVTQWDLETGKAIWSIPTKLTNHGGWMSVGASPTSLQAATGHDNSLRLWRMKSPVANPQVLEGHKGPVRSPTFSPDGRWLASADDAGLVLLWNAESGKKLREWQLPGPVHAVTFAHDGRHLATANGNGTVYILRIGTPPGS